MTVRRGPLLQALILGWCLFIPCFASGSQVFMGEGTAVIIDGDQTTALQLAETAALRQAVARAVESVIQPGTNEERNYHAKKGEILSEPYPFLAERKTGKPEITGKVLQVSVLIAVDREALTRFLGTKGVLSDRTAQRKHRDFPSVLVLIGEEIGGKLNTAPYSVRIVTQTFIDQGFGVVDETAVQKAVLHDQAVQGLLRGDAKAAQAVALQYGAGVVISGKTVAEATAMKAGAMQVYAANVTLQAIYADSGRILATAAADGSHPHIDAVTGSRKAIEDAAGKAASRLLQSLHQQFERSEDSLLVSISGINYRQLTVLKQILTRDFKTITSMESKSFQADVAKLALTIESSPQEFVDQLVLKDFGPFRLDLISFSPRKIDLVVKMKESPPH